MANCLHAYIHTKFVLMCSRTYKTCVHTSVRTYKCTSYVRTYKCICVYRNHACVHTCKFVAMCIHPQFAMYHKFFMCGFDYMRIILAGFRGFDLNPAQKHDSKIIRAFRWSERKSMHYCTYSRFFPCWSTPESDNRTHAAYIRGAIRRRARF